MHCVHAVIYSYFYNSTSLLFFFFNDTATTEIYTLSLHDALPICRLAAGPRLAHLVRGQQHRVDAELGRPVHLRSEEHTSELQSQSNLVCRLLLEKKKSKTKRPTSMAT